MKIICQLFSVLLWNFAAEGRPVMDWATRVKVAAGSARGIAYLHEDCNFPVTHSSGYILLLNTIYDFSYGLLLVNQRHCYQDQY